MGFDFFKRGSSQKETSANTRSERDGSTPNGGGMTTGRGGWNSPTVLGGDAAVGGQTWNRGHDSAGGFDRSDGAGISGSASGGSGTSGADTWGWGGNNGASGRDNWGWGGGVGGSSGSGDTWGTPGADPRGNPDRDPYSRS